MHDHCHTVQQLPIVSFNLDVPHERHLVLPRRVARVGQATGLRLLHGRCHDRVELVPMSLVFENLDSVLDDAVLHGDLLIHQFKMLGKCVDRSGVGLWSSF